MSPQLKEDLSKRGVINDDPLFDTEGARHYICTGSPPSMPTMERWRQKNVGPEWVKMLGLVYYRKSALDRYIEACTHKTKPLRKVVG